MGSAGVISLMSDGLAGPAVSSEGLACRRQGASHLAGQQEVQVWTEPGAGRAGGGPLPAANCQHDLCLYMMHAEGSQHGPAICRPILIVAAASPALQMAERQQIVPSEGSCAAWQPCLPAQRLQSWKARQSLGVGLTLWVAHVTAAQRRLERLQAPAGSPSASAATCAASCACLAGLGAAMLSSQSWCWQQTAACS